MGPRVELYEDDRTIPLYSGLLIRRFKHDLELTCEGTIELINEPNEGWILRYRGRSSDLDTNPAQHIDPFDVSLPQNPSWTLPSSPLASNDDDWTQEVLQPFDVGNLSPVKTLIIRLGPTFDLGPFADRSTSVDMSVPAWTLTLTPTGQQPFAHVITAIPDDVPTQPDTDELVSSIFAILDFVTSHRMGSGPLFGHDADGNVVWARFGGLASAQEFGLRWCPHENVTDTITRLCQASWWHESERRTILTRAIQLLLTTYGRAALELRIIAVCSAIELLAWGNSAMGRRDLTELDSVSVSGGGLARHLLSRAQISTTIPDHFTALDARRNGDINLGARS